MVKWNYWKDWDWFKALRNPDWAADIRVHVKEDSVPLRLKQPDELFLITNEQEYQELLKKIADAPFIAFDTEANSRNPFQGDFEVAGLCFAFDVVQGYYLPLNHKTPDFKFNKLFKNYKPPFLNFDQKRVFQDLLRLKFDHKPLICNYSSYELHVMYQLSRLTGVMDYTGHKGPLLDTVFYYRVQDPLRDNGLKGTTATMFGYEPIDFKEALGRDATFNATDPRKSKDYAAADPVNTLRHAYFQMNENFSEYVYDVCNVLEYPLASKLPEVEQFGVRLNVPLLEEYSSNIKPHLDIIAKEVRKVIGRDINLNSPDEKFKLLFTELRLPTPDGSKIDGTGADDIEELCMFIPEFLKKVDKAYDTLKEFVTQGRSGIEQLFAKLHRLLNKANTIYVPLHEDDLKGLNQEEVVTKFKAHAKLLFQLLLDTKERLKKGLDILELVKHQVVLAKLNSAFLEALPKKVSGQDGLLHTRFNQIVRSGRQSGTDPNLMQVPRNEEYVISYPNYAKDRIVELAGGLEVTDKLEIILPADVRKCIIPPEDWVFVRADLDAAEMRMLAAISGCPILTSVVLGKDEEGDVYDPHLKSVELLKLMKEDYITLKHALNDKTHELHKDAKYWRQMIKPINFGLVYGITEFGLAAQLKVTPEFARELMKKYFGVYTGVAKWLSDIHEISKKIGYSETVLGRRRTIPAYAYEDENELKHYVRACGNHVIQGNITGDIAKFCERQAIDALDEHKNIIRRTQNFSNYIHDEFVIACVDKPEVVQYCAAVLKATMEKQVSGILFTCGVEVTRSLSKKAENLIDNYPEYNTPELMDKVARKLNLNNRSELLLLPWWGPEVDALNKAA